MGEKKRRTQAGYVPVDIETIDSAEMRNFTADFLSRDAATKAHVSEADFPGDGASGDLMLFNTIRDLITRMIPLMAVMADVDRPERRTRRLPFLVITPLVRELIYADILAHNLDDDLYYKDRSLVKHRYHDEPLAKAVHRYVMNSYYEHFIKHGPIFEYETFCSDWRETLGYSAKTVSDGTGGQRAYHPVKEFFRRHPKTGEPTIKVRAHMRGSRDKAAEQYAERFGMLGTTD